MINNKIYIIGLLLFGLISCSHENEVEQPITGQIPAIDSLIEKEIAADHIPGAVIQVKKGDSILHRAAYGYSKKYDYNLKQLEYPQKMTTDHLFDLASLTKVCATTLGIMKLVDEGQIALDNPVFNYLPEFDQGEKSKITVRHLLTHSSGLAQWKPTYYYASNPQQCRQYIADLSLKWKVGEERHYSDLGFMVLGDIIEKVTGMPMNNYLQQEIYGPLDLSHTVFNPLEKELEPVIAATSHGNPFEKQMVYDNNFGYRVAVEPELWDGWRQYTLQGEVNDGNAWYANKGVAGHAGLFSSVDNLQVLIDLLLHDGVYGGEQIISPSVVDTFLTEDRFGNGLGWAMDSEFISAEGSPAGTFGHTGFTGTSIVAVPRDSLSIILLTNRQNVGRQENGYYFDLGPLRQAVYNAVKKER
ncbi:serine hydrolase domain-containing protein [Fodinibius saliphilus]|uniref:serine hydrolase domain-containing protein n=1 Tax=Fodinibius saliphilus TaxID=1920650 RepID=UPI001107E3AA|nr:serine hydrolase [Fodinibius saliphilus]